MRFELVELQRRLGQTSLYVTHDQSEAMLMSDRIILMKRWRDDPVRHARVISMSGRQPGLRPSSWATPISSRARSSRPFPMAGCAGCPLPGICVEGRFSLAGAPGPPGPFSSAFAPKASSDHRTARAVRTASTAEVEVDNFLGPVVSCKIQIGYPRPSRGAPRAHPPIRRRSHPRPDRSGRRHPDHRALACALKTSKEPNMRIDSVESDLHRQVSVCGDPAPTMASLAWEKAEPGDSTKRPPAPCSGSRTICWARIRCASSTTGNTCTAGRISADRPSWPRSARSTSRSGTSWASTSKRRSMPCSAAR